MKPHVCSECEKGMVRLTRGRLAIDVRDEKYELDGVDYLRCDTCGAISFTREQDRIVEMRAASEARAAHGLMTGPEIAELRHYLNDISQTDLEEILSMGPKTITRWERGTVFQSHANDALLRIIRVVAESLSLPSRLDRVQLVHALRDLPRLVATVTSEQRCWTRDLAEAYGPGVLERPEDTAVSQAS